MATADTMDGSIDIEPGAVVFLVRLAKKKTDISVSFAATRRLHGGHTTIHEL